MRMRKTSSTYRFTKESPMNPRSRRILLALAAVAAAMVRAQQPAPDLVLLNGKIVTVDDRFAIAQAVAVRGDRIAAAGTTEEITHLAGPGTRRIDLRGRTVIPGLIDNHMHLLRAATTWSRELRFDGVDSRRAAIELLRARTKAVGRSEEHTSELQSHVNLVCRLLLEKKKIKKMRLLFIRKKKKNDKTKT